MRRAIFFLNPVLGMRGNRRAVVEQCAAILRAEGCAAEVRDTLAGRDAGGQAREAVESGFDTVFACGGDGTLFQLLQGVAGSQAALGVIPLGTGNVLARNLRLPRDPIAALRAQWSAEAVEIPLGEIACGYADECERSWYFTIAAGVGIHASVLNLPSGLAKRLWGRGAYYSGGVRLLLRHSIQPFDVEMTAVDGEVREFSACELLAVRVPAIDRWRPGSDLRSPHLRVAAIPHTGRAGLAHASFHAVITHRSRSGTMEKLRLPYPYYEDAVQVICRPASGFMYKSPLLVQADGDVIGMERATLRMAQKRFRLLWPRGV